MKKPRSHFPPHTPHHLNTATLQPALADESRVQGADPLDGAVDHLVDDGLGGLALVDDGGGLAHEEGAGVVEGVVVELIALLLHVVLDGDDAARRQVLDLLLAVLLPVLDVRVRAHAQRSAREDDGADVVVEAGRADGVLVSAGSTGFL